MLGLADIPQGFMAWGFGKGKGQGQGQGQSHGYPYPDPNLGSLCMGDSAKAQQGEFGDNKEEEAFLDH